MASTSTRPLAGMFLRIVLSHLLVVLLCLIAGGLTFDYLFGSGVRYFLVHDPIFLVPVMLVLIGLAGLLAVWTTAAMARPLENVTEALHAPDSLTLLRMQTADRHTDESRQLLDAITRALEHVPVPSDPVSTEPAANMPALAEIDGSGRIVSVSPTAARVAGTSPMALVGHPFVDIYADADPGAAASELGERCIAGASPFSLQTLHLQADAAPRLLQWHAVAVRGMFGRSGTWMLRLESGHETHV